MFYSESLLSKTGPLARVWLSANLERKLSKTHILQSDIKSSVGAIVDQGQAPMALRLSGQLLLGVVRIYKRQAGYLLDDCNDALVKIKMAFRMTSNNDLTGQPANPIDLNLPEVLTEADLLANLDMSNLLSQSLNLDINDKLQNFGTDWTSTLNPESGTQSRLTPEERPHLEDDTGLELDFGEDAPLGRDDTDMSVEIGRSAPSARPVGEEFYSDDNKVLEGDDLDLDLGEDVLMPDAGGIDLDPAGDYDNINNFLGDDDEIVAGGDETLQLRNAGALPRSESPLSDARSEIIHDLDGTFGEPGDVEEEVIAQQPQRSKKRKLLVLDTETTLHNHQIKEQQNDRSKILGPVSFLPRDPLLLTLMNMQKNGDFVSNIMGDGRSRGWAPELRGILSIDVVRNAGELKRKRDSGISDVSVHEPMEKTPRLELGDEEDLLIDEGIGLGGDSSLNQTQIELPADDAARNEQDDEDEGIGPGFDTFDDTTVPLIHPADNGPVSLGTKHAVHLLRDRLGGEEADGSPASQAKKAVLFQDLLPERKATREDATKLFFEVLVLATKDAVKVEQISGSKVLGGPLRVRGKRGLWGSWAESQAEPALETCQSLRIKFVGRSGSTALVSSRPAGDDSSRYVH